MKRLITLLTALLMTNLAYANVYLEAGKTNDGTSDLMYIGAGYVFDNALSLNAHYIYGDNELYRKPYTNQTVDTLVYYAHQSSYIGITVGYTALSFKSDNLFVSLDVQGGYELQQNEYVSQYYLTDTERRIVATDDKDNYGLVKLSLSLGYDVFYLKAIYDTEQRLAMVFGVNY